MAASRRRKTGQLLLLGLCLLASLLSIDLFPEDLTVSRRYLTATADRRRRRARGRNADRADAGPLYPWARHHLLPLTATPARETVVFWHINKSGGTTAQSLMACLGRTNTQQLTLASRVGALPRFGHDRDAALVVFRPWKGNDATYVNVDTSSAAGMLRAARMGLVASGLADVIVSADPAFAVAHLYDRAHRGRATALFRHPVERLVSKFYYLQTATWERTYHPAWKNVTVLQFAKNKNRDNNFMVKKLAGKKMNAAVGEEDLLLAMATLSQRFVVGLTNRMEESMRRFNVVLGIDEQETGNIRCMDEFFGHGEQRKNANPHPQVKKGSPAWKAFAAKNALDIRLYAYILELFEEQTDLIASYVQARTAPAPHVTGRERALR